MLRVQPRPKEMRKVAIPAELREALREVMRIIADARQDPGISLNYGDAIQVGPLSGGRVGRKKRPFEFTYYPGNERGRAMWFLDLHPLDIEDIADSHLAEITMHCCMTPECGVMSNVADGRYCSCDYVEDADFGHFKFPQAQERLQKLGIVGLSMTSKKEDVMAVLGPPDESGGGYKERAIGWIPAWIKYYRVECQLHFEFDPSERVHMVTVMKKDWKPGQ